MPTRTLAISHPDCAGHDTGPGHPESARRLDALLAAIEEAIPQLEGRVERFHGRRASPQEVALVHPPAHIELIQSAAAKAREAESSVYLDPDTVVSAGSFDAALATVGTVLTAIDRIVDGSAKNAFCVARPPGHHATLDRAMGFCLFNNIAVGARYAQDKGLARPLIVDWDVHHGNGTEAIFYEDADVFYLSMHQSPHYPGTGHRNDRGRGDGEGTTLNLPVPPGLPAARYADEFMAGFDAAVSEFSPDMIFISAGFDAAYGDPLAGLTLTPVEYHALTRHVLDSAASHCDGRVVSALEGGYNLENLTRCGLAHLRALADLGLG
jgi:acetoin utilization deacetylase AcuC-like enzyme